MARTMTTSRSMEAVSRALDTPAADSGEAKRYVRCGPGEGVTNPRPADLILVRGSNWMSKLIRCFERIRYRSPEDRPFTHWSHAALVVTPAGHLIEVLDTGVLMSTLEKYKDWEYHYVYLDLPESDRRQAVRFAYSCLREKYGLFSFLTLAIMVLVGDRIHVPDRGQQGCVAMVVRALQRAGMTFERRPTDMTPADLAKHFHVMP
jgi:hypothetical protein